MTTQMRHENKIEHKEIRAKDDGKNLVKGNFSYLSMVAVAGCLLFCAGIILYAIVI